MTMFTIRDRRISSLIASLLLALALLGLDACGTVRSGSPGEAQAPGIQFHNDIVMFGAVGGGSSSR